MRQSLSTSIRSREEMPSITSMIHSSMKKQKKVHFFMLEELIFRESTEQSMLRTKLLSKPSKRTNRELLKRLGICLMKNSKVHSLIILKDVPLINVIVPDQLRMMKEKASKRVKSALQRHPILMMKRSKKKEKKVKKRTIGLSIMLTNLKRRLRVVKQDQRHKSQIDQE